MNEPCDCVECIFRRAVAKQTAIDIDRKIILEGKGLVSFSELEEMYSELEAKNEKLRDEMRQFKGKDKVECVSDCPISVYAICRHLSKEAKLKAEAEKWQKCAGVEAQAKEDAQAEVKKLKFEYEVQVKAGLVLSDGLDAHRVEVERLKSVLASEEEVYSIAIDNLRVDIEVLKKSRCHMKCVEEKDNLKKQVKRLQERTTKAEFKLAALEGDKE